VQTPDAILSKGMRQLDGVYTQATNRRHGLVGHLFQGRFKAILVERDAYLLELARYLVLKGGDGPGGGRLAVEQLSRDGRTGARPRLAACCPCG
jgi:hypothetical protein